MKYLLVALLSLLAPAAFAQVLDKPAATVNLTKPQYISTSQLDSRVEQLDAIRRQNGIPIPPDDKSQVLNSMIAEILIQQAAVRDNVTVSQAEINDFVANQRRSVEAQLGTITDDQFRNIILQQTGMNWDQYLANIKTQLTQQRYILQTKGDLINNVPVPTEDQIAQRYGQIASRLTNPEIIRFSQVFIDTHNLSSADKQKAYQRAQDIYRQYVNGQTTFDQLVTQYTDDQKARYNGGDFGYLARDDVRAIQLFGQSFMDQIFALKTGQVSGVLESRIGYHIVKVTEHYPPKLLTLDDQLTPTNKMTVREYIRDTILQEEKNQAFQQAVQDVVANLKKQADIQIFSQNLN